MVIQCKNLISLYILPDQRRGNLLVRIINEIKSLSIRLKLFISFDICKEVYVPLIKKSYFLIVTKQN